MTFGIAFFGLVAIAFTTLLLAKTRHASLLGPIGIFSFIFGFVYFAVPVIALSLEMTRTDPPTDSVRNGLFVAIAYYLTAAIGFALGRPLGQFKGTLRFAASHIGEDERGLVPFLFVVQLISAAYVILFMLPYLGVGYSEFMMNRIALSEGKGYLMEPAMLGMPIALLLTAPALAGKPRRAGAFWLVALCSVALTAWAGMLVGSRLNAAAGIVYLVVSAGILRRSHGGARWLAGVGVCLLVAVAILGVVRSSIARGGLEKGTITDDIRASGAAVVVRDIANDFGQLESLAIVEAKDADWSLAYGKTYVSALLLPIPRVWWRDKPLGAGPMLSNIIKPGTYDPDRKYRSSTTPGCVTEAYLNGGVAGVIVVALIHGFLIASLTRFGARVRSRGEYVIYVLLMFFLGEMLVYGEFGGSLTRIGVYILPVILYVKVRTLVGATKRRPLPVYLKSQLPVERSYGARY